MTLGQVQRKFTLMIAKLIIFAYEQGYELTLGEGYDDDGVGHIEGSTHYIRLAQDFNLFKDDKFLYKSEDHDPLHDYWDTLGGAQRIKRDGNHYSFEWEGRR